MIKVNINPTEIFRGEHTEFYKGSHEVILSPSLKFFVTYVDFCDNSLIQPHISDIDIINQWRLNTKIKLKNDFIPCYKGLCNVVLNYYLYHFENKKFLIIIGGEEIQPMVYRICLEEVWALN